MIELPAALGGMGDYRQFIVYYTTPRPDGKTDKFPCHHKTGMVANAHDPDTWTDIGTAVTAARRFGGTYGVGFVFTNADPFWFLDVDSCLVDGQWSPLAVQLCAAFPGAAIEVSQSGRGLHVFGTGVPPPHGCKNSKLNLELYHTGRFVALTGTGIVGDIRTDHSTSLVWLVENYFPDAPANFTGWTDGPCPEWNGPTDDADLLRRALRSKSAGAAFGTKASFADLWHGDHVALTKAYLDPSREYDCSSADAALAQHLAFWTGNDCERISRLMRQSGLVREKWQREDYLPRTILGATSRQFDVLQDKPTKPPVAQPGSPGVTMRESGGFLNAAGQVALFQGCVYVQDCHKVMVPGGTLLKPDQFRVAYGGHAFTLDTANEKTTRDAWEAFTNNQAFSPPKAHSVCFKPAEQPGGLVIVGDQTFVNIFHPVPVPCVSGDPAPFLTHLAKVLRNDRDRLIALSYMAAVVQHQGVKFQWALLLQGVEGNGKTLFTRCVAEAVGRRYTHWPNAAKLAEKFNGWMVGKVFFGVEDIYVPGQKFDIFERLKPMITGGDGIEIEAKGVDQISLDICGNFMFNTNHKDAIIKTKTDRRFAVMFTAQQVDGDVVRDGMGGDYFPNLYNWLRSGGYAIVTYFLKHFQIPDEFNPATSCQRAPWTSSTTAAIDASRGAVEQEVLEAIAQNAPGFSGGWVSLLMLDRLLDERRLGGRMTRNQKKEMLETLGYQPHPSLPGGRVNSPVMPDGGKPQLYLTVGHPALTITSPAAIGKSYESSNLHFAGGG